MDPENVGTEAIVRVTHWLRSIWEMRRRGGPVQQWVDSIPSYGTASSSFTQSQAEESGGTKLPDNSTTSENGNNKSGKDLSFPKKKLARNNDDMIATAPIIIPNSPAITMTGPASAVPHNRLVRDPSLQSDSSHCSSVESLLEWRKADPEAILLGLGFGYPSSPQENGSLARIPRRFLQPSKLKGIAVDEFLKQQQQSSESLDSASLGYRGLTGSPYVAPSEIVQKIMERLREHESHEGDSYTNTNSSSELFGSMQQDGRLSVLSPDNRQYLERPRSKSPDMRNKRMIIGEKSFTFGYNGDLIEVESLNNTEEVNFQGNLNHYQLNSNDPTIKTEKEVSVSTQATEKVVDEKPGKLSGRRLAKQLSFDEDRTQVYEGIGDNRKDSLPTNISRWSDSNKYTRRLSIPNRFSDTRSDSTSRRSSDSLYDLKSRIKALPPVEERRMSYSGIETKVQSFEDKKKSTSDKKPSLKRQARVSDADEISYEMESVVRSCQDLFPIPVTSLDKIDDYVSEDETLRAEYNNDKQVVSWNFNASVKSDDSIIGSNSNSDVEDLKVCCINSKDECCKNDELNQIFDHEEISTDCCCLTSGSKCWRKMSKVMRRNQKLEDMVAKTKQEMAELREKLNNAMSVKKEPGSQDI